MKTDPKMIFKQRSYSFKGLETSRLFKIKNNKENFWKMNRSSQFCESWRKLISMCDFVWIPSVLWPLTIIRAQPRATQKRMGPVRSVSFMMLPSAGMKGFNTVSVFCHMWSKSTPSSEKNKQSKRLLKEESKLQKTNKCLVKLWRNVYLSEIKKKILHQQAAEVLLLLQRFSFRSCWTSVESRSARCTAAPWRIPEHLDQDPRIRWRNQTHFTRNVGFPWSIRAADPFTRANRWGRAAPGSLAFHVFW